MSLFSTALKWVSLSHTCEAGSCWIWSCNYRSKDWVVWPSRSPLWNYAIGSSEPPLKATTFGGGMKWIRWTVCKISTTLVWSRKRWNWSCNYRSKYWLAWPTRSPLWNCAVGSSEPPLKPTTFGGGMKSIRRTVCKILTALVWSGKLLKLKLQLQK